MFAEDGSACTDNRQGNGILVGHGTCLGTPDESREKREKQTIFQRSFDKIIYARSLRVHYRVLTRLVHTHNNIIYLIAMDACMRVIWSETGYFCSRFREATRGFSRGLTKT